MDDIASSKLHLKVVGLALVRELKRLDQMKMQNEVTLSGGMASINQRHQKDKEAEGAVDLIHDEDEGRYFWTELLLHFFVYLMVL